MREERLRELVGELIVTSFDGIDRDVATALLEDREDRHGGFAALCRRVATAAAMTGSGESEDGVKTAWAFLMSQVDDELKDRIASGVIQQPALYLGARI